MPITALNLRHADALTAFEADFAASGAPRIDAYFADPDWSHARKVQEVNAWSQGRLLKPGWSACTTRFLEVDGELAGVVNIRHELSESLRDVGGHIGYSVRPSFRRRGHATALLRAGLDWCRGLGIDQALLTCDESNIASIGVIHKHNGRLFETDARVDGSVICRFWVPTA